MPATVSAEKIALALGGKREGKGWRCHCPVPGHVDKNPSCFVSDGPSGVIVKCYSRCSWEEVVEALEAMGLWEKPKKRARPGSVPARSEWQCITPIPDSAPPLPDHPDLGHPTAVWTYRNEHGEPIMHHCRFKTPKGKEYRSLTWAESSGAREWRWQSLPPKRPLYNLDQIVKRAALDVILCEGEKAADAAGKLFASMVSTCWPNGARSVSSADWSTLQGRVVYYSPDNDKEGRDSIGPVSARLVGVAKQVHILDWTRVYPDLREKWDLADTDEVEGFDPTRLHDAIVPAAGPGDKKPLVVPLGYDHDTYYYLAAESRQITALQAAKHTKLNLYSLVSSVAYWQTYAGWEDATTSLMAAAKAAGPFSAQNIRGRGAWLDSGSTVVHLGTRLIVDGQERDLLLRPGRNVYEAQQGLCGPLDPPLTDEEASRVLITARAFNWGDKLSGTLLAGWIALAPICGALDWRPHIWITSSQGAGKSWISTHFIKPLLAGMDLHIIGNCTEAGIRQRLGIDALPVLFDESENESSASQRISHVIQLIRQSSSESGGDVVKGSATGSAVAFKMRSMFCLVSIGVTVDAAADRARINVLELGKGLTGSTWEALQKAVAEMDLNFGRRLLGRTVGLIDTIRANALEYSRVLAGKLGSQRLADQYGALLAGARSLTTSAKITRDEVQDSLQGITFSLADELREESDEDQVLRQLLGACINVDVGGRMASRSIGELVDAAACVVETHRVQEATQALRRVGVIVKPDAGVVRFASSSQQLRALLGGTPWQAGWARILSRVEGARPAGPQYIGPGIFSRGIDIPLDKIGIKVSVDPEERLPF